MKFKIVPVREYNKEELLRAIEVQDKLAFGLDYIEKGIKTAPQGVMVSGYTVESLERNFEKGAVFYIGMDESTNSCCGFLHVVSSKGFSSKLEDASIKWKVSEFEKYRSILERSNYIYLDQIGVLSEYQKSGLAYDLLLTFEKENTGQEVIVLIMTEPIDNIRSTNFFLKNGYRIFAEVFFSKFGLVNDFKGILLHKRL